MYIKLKKKKNHCTIVSILLDIFLNVSCTHTTITLPGWGKDDSSSVYFIGIRLVT